MPLPKLDDSQITWITKEVALYIEAQRQAYRTGGAPLDRNERAAMQPFFPASCLDSTRVVLLSNQRVTNPPFYGELLKMGFDAISLPVPTHDRNHLHDGCHPNHTKGLFRPASGKGPAIPCRVTAARDFGCKSGQNQALPNIIRPKISGR